jgi:site-specific DNA recombinase
MTRRRPPRTAAQNRIVLYIRVSALMGRIEGSSEFHSPELQRDAITRHVEPLGMKVVGEICDIDVSGRKFAREGLDELRALVETKKVDVVGLYNLSRLGRNVLESLAFIAWLRKNGVTVISSKEQIDDTPAGQFMLNQFLAIAQLQSDQIAQGWTDLIERRAQLGIQHGSAPAIGYLRVNKQLVVDPIVGPAVTEAFRCYADGWTISDITQALNKVRDRRVDRRTLKQMFRNPVYIGKVHLHKQVIGDGQHPALVDLDTWQQVHERLERDRRTPPRTLAVSHSLVGILHCDLCARTLKRNDEYQKSGRVVPRVYCQFSHKMYRPHHCTGVGVPRLDLIEAEALRQLAEHIRRLKADHRAREVAEARKAKAGTDKARLQKQLDEARAALGRLAALLARGQITDQEHAAAVVDLRAAEHDLTEKLATARAVTVAPTSTAAVVAAEAIFAEWGDATVPERNVLLRKVLRDVRVRPAAHKDEPVAARVKTIPVWA